MLIPDTSGNKNVSMKYDNMVGILHAVNSEILPPPKKKKIKQNNRY